MLDCAFVAVPGAAFFAAAFFAGVFFAGVFFAGVFFAAALAGVFFAGALDFFAFDFLGGMAAADPFRYGTTLSMALLRPRRRLFFRAGVAR